MTQNPDIKNQVYQCFLMEASSLLPALEQDLLSYLEEPTTNKVHSLMRNAHTFKGSAASAEQETISTVAHHLEDVFQALYNPDIILDEELSALLWECYECLRESVTAEIDKSFLSESELIKHNFDENEILNRVAVIFAQLQTKLGDFFEREASIPNSEELGFDVIGSVFAESMQQELRQLEAVLATGDVNQIALTLSSEAEFFTGIAESYSLPGIKELAKTILMALEQNPAKTIEIAELALEDLEKARVAILEGDRSHGGEPSIALKKLVTKEESIATRKLNELVHIIESKLLRLEKEERSETCSWSGNPTELPRSASTSSKLLSATEIDEDTRDNEIETISASVESDRPTDIVVVSQQQKRENNSNARSFAEDEIAQIKKILNFTTDESHQLDKTALSDQKQNSSSPKSTFSSASNRRDVRVDLTQLESLNYIFGELLISQNQQSLQTQKSETYTQKTLQQLQKCQESLQKMLDWSDRYFSHLKTAPPALHTSTSVFSLADSLPAEQFDLLEMDAYGEMHIFIQSTIETMSQLQARIEEIDSSIKQSELMLKKQKKLITDAQENLIQARMIPVGLLLNRFPPIMKQLVSVNHKDATLELSGTDIFIDKTISEKLFDPLLHLLRNAIAHGIESSEIRQKQGKPAVGKIQIKAYHQGNRTTIEVIDDGRGLNWETIRQQAIAQQFFSPHEAATASENELADLLFQPGFSTSQNLDNWSGRGIGLDAVRTSIEQMQGSIQVSSVAGEGTVFALHLPLVLMTAEMLVCQSQGIIYALKADSIERVLKPDANQITTQKIVQGHAPQHFLLWKEGTKTQQIPIRTLDSLLTYRFSPDIFTSSLADPSSDGFTLLAIEHQDQLLCLAVEKIITKQELAIKSLHKKPTLPSYIQGYSLLGDGRLVMALDPLELVSQTWSRFDAASSNKSFSQQISLNNSPPLSWSAEIEESRLLFDTESSDRLFNSSIGLNSTLALQNRAILIVEDSLTQRKLLTSMLEKAGCFVFQAREGQEALRQLRQHPEIELIICDIEMPVMNGFEFLYAYQQDSTLSPVDVVMLSSRSGKKHRQMSFKLGAKAYLTKPYSEQELLSLLSDLITQKTLTLH